MPEGRDREAHGGSKIMSKRDHREIKSLADYIRGLADGMYHQQNTDAARKLAEAADWLDKAARNTCIVGYVGCHGGPDCNSDHK